MGESSKGGINEDHYCFHSRSCDCCLLGGWQKVRGNGGEQTSLAHSSWSSRNQQDSQLEVTLRRTHTHTQLLHAKH